MNATFRSVETLLACRILTEDGVEAGLTDLIFDADAWRVQFLVADTQSWAPDRDAILAPRLVSGIDEARGLISVDLTAAELQASPLLAVGDGVAGFDNAGMAVPPNWREHWRSRIQPEGDIPEGGLEPPPPPARDDEVAADLGVETDLSAEQLIRADSLRGTRAETADGRELLIQDLLIDDSDWTLAYLDLLRADDRGASGGQQAKSLRCLLGRNGIDWLNPKTETLHLRVFIQEMRDAPARPMPVAGGAGKTVRMLEPED